MTSTKNDSNTFISDVVFSFSVVVRNEQLNTTIAKDNAKIYALFK